VPFTPPAQTSAATANSDDADKESTCTALAAETQGDYPKALRKYIASFGAGPSSGAGSSGVGLGDGPPCRSYRQLQCISDVDKVEDNLQGCQTKEAVSAILSGLKTLKQAYSDLIGMGLASAVRLKNAQAQRLKDEAAKRAPVAKAPGRKKAAVTETKFTVLTATELPAEVVAPPVVPSHVTTFKVDPAPDFSKPVVIRFDATVLRDKFTEHGGQLKKLSEAYIKKADYATSTRQSYKASATMKAPLDEVIDAILPAGYRIKGDLATDVQAQLDPSLMAQHHDTSMCNSEFCFLANFRLCFSGTREVVLGQLSPWLNHLTAKQGKAVQPAELYSYIKNASIQELTADMQGDAARHLTKVTVGPNDALFTPCGFFFFESVKGVDVLTVKYPLLSAKHAQCLDALIRYLTPISKSPALLQAMSDVASLAD